MSQKRKKQFGVWMDSHQAIIVGIPDSEEKDFSIMGHSGSAGSNSKDESGGEKNSHAGFYKEILSHMQNAEEVHITGTGTAQEQFLNYMAASPQFKNARTTESTSNKMSEEALVEFITAKFN